MNPIARYRIFVFLNILALQTEFWPLNFRCVLQNYHMNTLKIFYWFRFDRGFDRIIFMSLLTNLNINILKQLQIGRDTTTSKIQEELQCFEKKPFVGKLVAGAQNRDYTLYRSLTSWFFLYDFGVTVLASACLRAFTPW